MHVLYFLSTHLSLRAMSDAGAVPHGCWLGAYMLHDDGLDWLLVLGLLVKTCAGIIWNDILLSDTHSLNITRPYSDAQSRSAWKAKTVIART